MDVLITGATKGIGFEVARRLAERGETVIVTARDETRATAAAGEIGGRPLALDVTDAASVRAAAPQLERLDVLVNNAAAYVDWTETASEADLDASRAVMETNLYGAWRASMAFLPALRRADKPRIVNVSSGGGSHGDEMFGLTRRGGAAASYGISKAALNALTSTLAAELAGDVVVAAVCPGLTATWPGAEQMGARPVEEGAASVLWAIDEAPTGGFFRDGEALPW